MKIRLGIFKIALALGVLPWAAQPAIARLASVDGGDGQGFYFPTTGVTVERQALLLAVDDYLLPLKDCVCYYISTPRYRAEPVLAADQANPKAPDQVAAHFFGTVLHDGGKFRMWYYACRWDDPATRKTVLLGPVCYAESDDGIRWTKPNLGQFEIGGSKNNNALFLPGDRTEGVCVLKDDGDPDRQRRYKMVYNTWNGKTFVIRNATSPDGIRWQAASDYSSKKGIEISSFYRFDGFYVVTGQTEPPSEGGHRSGRQGYAFISVDFDHWNPGTVDSFLLPEPGDPALRGSQKPYDQVHLGVGAASFGNVLVGLYGLWHNRPGPFGQSRTSCDLGLAVSDDGLHFREPVKGRVFISRLDTPATPFPGADFPTNLVQSGNGILNVGDETRIYFSRWLNAELGQGYAGEVALATLPRDRWGALGLYPKDAGTYRDRGSVWSAPVRIPAAGCRIILNADHTGGMTVEISDARLQLLPDYSFGRGGRPKDESGLDCAVEWPAGSLSALGGQTVRFKVNFAQQSGADSRLYAIYLKTRD